MLPRRIIQALVFAFTAFTFSLPGQAAMVGTAQIQQGVIAEQFASIDGQRAWLREQLVIGGIDEAAAEQRVAALTDSQVRDVFQRIDELPAGAGVGEVLLVALIVLLVLEVFGYTDFVPD